MSILDDLAKQLALSESELEQARALVESAVTRHKQAETDLAGAGDKLDDAALFGRLNTAVQHALFLRQKAEGLLEQATIAVETSRAALARAERQERVRSLRQAASIDIFQRVTADDAKAIVDCLATAKAAAQRIDAKWRDVERAGNELRGLGEALEHPSEHARFASLLIAVLHAAPRDFIAQHGPSTYTPPRGHEGTGDIDRDLPRLCHDLREHGLAEALVPELLKTTLGTPERRTVQLSRLASPFYPLLAEPVERIVGATAPIDGRQFLRT